MDTPVPAKNTSAFFAQSAVAFGVALFTMLVAISRLDPARLDRILAEHDPWKETA
jgi:hypothetical protein